MSPIASARRDALLGLVWVSDEPSHIDCATQCPVEHVDPTHVWPQLPQL
jgi:hypothetical protein